jgi:hypothetical protein
VMYAPMVEAKGKPPCHPNKVLPSCPTTTTTTTTPTSTTSTSTTSSTTSTSTTSTSTTSTSTTSTTAPTTTTTAPTTTTTVPAGGSLLWAANADTDVDHGADTDCMDKHLEGDGSSLTIVNDPLAQNGKVYRASVVGANRAEWDKAYVNCANGDNGVLNLWGTNSPSTDTLYIGWRSLFAGNWAINTGSNNGGNLVQWKGDSSCGGPAVGMTIRYGRLSLRTIDGDPPGVEGLWNDTVLFSNRMGAWHDFVMLVNFAKDSTGYIELWVDGVHQVMSDGTFRHEGPTVCAGDSRVYPKHGVYDTPSGSTPIHYSENPRIGTSYAAVAP